MYFKAVVIWISLSVLAVLNGITRNYLITPVTGEHGGHVISTVILCVVIFFVAWLVIGWIRPGDPGEARVIGLLWVLMTLAFEFLAGHYLFGHSWNRLVADYNMARGRVWTLVLFASYFAPIWAARVKRIY